MRHYSGPSQESFVLFSEEIVLGCGCGDKLILLGLEEDWRSEKTTFECECGTELTLANRTDEGTTAIGRILRGSIRAYNPGA